MKLNHADDISEVIGNTLNSGTMGVKVTSKLFSLMIDGLYQDKYGAVVREICTNALDAHDKIGIKNMSFDICIPDGIQNCFSVRDYGPGLSKENMIKFFCTLLESDKDNSNDARGAYGIGCKSPFAVVDEFTVTSWHNGLKTVMLISRENKGTPTYYVLSEEPSTESTGVLVELESSEDKHLNWMNAVKTQLAAFKEKPNTNIPVDWYDIEYIYEDKLYLINNDQNKMYVEMGEILYPIDISAVRMIFKKSNKKSIVLKLNIGDVTPPPDRERIEQTEESISLITNVAKDVYESLNKKYVEDFSKSFDGTKKFYYSFIKDKYFLNNNLDSLINFNIENLEHYVSTLYKKNILLSTSEKLNYNILHSDMDIKLYECSISQHNSYNFSKTHPCINSILANGHKVLISNNARLIDVEDYMKANKLKNVMFIKTTLRKYEDLVSYISNFMTYYEFDFKNVTFLGKGTRKIIKVKTPYTAAQFRGLFKAELYSYRRLTVEELQQLNDDASKKEIILVKDYKRMNHNSLYNFSLYCDKIGVQLILCDIPRYDNYIKKSNTMDLNEYINIKSKDVNFMFRSILEEDEFYSFYRKRNEYYDIISPYIKNNKDEFLNFLVTRSKKYDKINLLNLFNMCGIKTLNKYSELFSKIEISKKDLKSKLSEIVKAHY